MKIPILALIVTLVISSCGHKEEILQPNPVPPHPEMTYKDLHDVEVKFNESQHIDMDGDGRRDFSVATLHIGDPLLQREIIQFLVTSPEDRFAMADSNNNAAIFNQGDVISENAVSGNIWYEITASILSEKIMELSGNTFWQGKWVNSVNKYFPFYMKKNGNRFFGWLELSMNTNEEKVVLHGAAVCKEPGKAIKAGL